MSITVIQPGALVPLDPNDMRVVVADWDDDNLAAGITIATSTWTITVIKQNGLTILTKDSAAKLSAAEATAALERTVTINRATHVRLIASTATLGDVYDVENVIVTDENPTQTKAKSFRVL